MIGVLLLAALPFVIDGGDVEQAAPPPPFDFSKAWATVPSDCVTALAEVQEGRRLVRDTLVTLGVNTLAHFGDLATTEWAESRYACRDAPGAVLCTYESNVWTPTGLGRFAAKFVIVTGITGLSYIADKLGHRRWAKFIRWLGAGAGFVLAGRNIYQGLQVEESRAQ